MLRTRFCELMKVDLPIVSAGMGAIALSSLASAVSEAGGMGTIGTAGFTAEGIVGEIAAARRLTKKPFAVNFLIPFYQPELLAAALESKADAVTFFWGDEPRSFVDTCHKAGARVIWQCGSAEEAAKAGKAGVDAVIAQGLEAGGHVRGMVGTFALIPQVRDAIGDLPMLAAGGIADGRGLAAAIALGADGAVFGTRFIASEECRAHDVYKRRVLEGRGEETIHTKLFDIGWPDAAHRVLRSKVVDEWEKAGRPETGKRPGEGKPLGYMNRSDMQIPLVRYGVFPPADYVEGEVDELAFYAGQGVTTVNKIAPAAEIVKEIATQARETIAGRLSALVQ